MFFSAFNAHALGAVAEVAGAGLNAHLSTVLPALLSAMGDDEHPVRCYKQLLFLYSLTSLYSNLLYYVFTADLNNSFLAKYYFI